MGEVIRGKFASIGDAPWYMLRFGEDGKLLSPETQALLLADIRQGGYSDIIFFSHGWNNSWQDAVDLYQGFFDGYMNEIHQPYEAQLTRPFKPLFVGINWPSIQMLLPWEKPPQVASINPDETLLRMLTANLSQVDRTRVEMLAQQNNVSEEEAIELLQRLRPVFERDVDPLPEAGAVSSQTADLLHQVRLNQSMVESSGSHGEIPTDFTSGGFIDDDVTDHGLPTAAADLSRFDPRFILRLVTIWKMKDRAGLVGAYGASPLFQAILQADERARFRVVGHSFGCKVALTGISFAPLPRKIDSLLLLQPAVSHLCFADKARDHRLTESGGYRPALARVKQPILSTFSQHDGPLYKAFHLAVRRKSDLAEVQIAAVGDEPPSQFAALGGYGPRGFLEGEGKLIKMKRPREAYVLQTEGLKILGLDGGDFIHNHNDISNKGTYWALFNQITA